jgi:signal transduction histidine kinase
MTSKDIIKVNFLATTIDPVPAEVALCLYRIAQESLLNARKYSNSNNVILAVARNDGVLCMQIKDSGVGFDLNIPSEGLGFVNMRERLRTIGGELSIDSKLGEGTNVTAIVHLGSESNEAKAS